MVQDIDRRMGEIALKMLTDTATRSERSEYQQLVVDRFRSDRAVALRELLASLRRRRVEIERLTS